MTKKYVYTREEILEEIKNRTPFGLEILELEAEYYLDLIKDSPNTTDSPSPKHNNDFKAHKSSPKPCHICKGSGRLPVIKVSPDAPNYVKCKFCQGTGRAS